MIPSHNWCLSIHSFVFPSDFYKMFLFISPCFSLEGISPIFTVEGTEAQTSLMPVQESKWFSSVQLLSLV